MLYANWHQEKDSRNFGSSIVLLVGYVHFCQRVRIYESAEFSSIAIQEWTILTVTNDGSNPLADSFFQKLITIHFRGKMMLFIFRALREFFRNHLPPFYSRSSFYVASAHPTAEFSLKPRDRINLMVHFHQRFVVWHKKTFRYNFVSIANIRAAKFYQLK